jgi:hypothetical protein
MTARKKKNLGFGWARSRVTYHRDVAGERKELKRQAFADRRERLSIKKLEAQERAAAAKIAAADRKIAAAESKIAKASTKGAGRGGTSEAAFEAMKERMEREIQAQEEHKRTALAKVGNPSWGYGIYQGRGFETRQLAHFRSKAAAETYARSAGLKGYSIKRAFAKDQNPARRNCEVIPASHHSTSAEYQLGYSLGQRDRETASLRRTPGELEATFRAKFDPARASTLMFAEGYEAGYGSTGGTAAGNSRGQMSRGLSRNPETDDEYEQSRKIAELFHGRPVKEEITVTESIREHDWLWRIGPLVKLKVKTVRKQRATFPFSLKGDALVHLMCSPDGRQLYLRDGDMQLDLEPLGMAGDDWKRDKMVIGEISEITYQDRKKFHSFDPVQYWHKLGEETKVKPWLIYDTMNEKLEIVGGQYYVETKELVEEMSPGLVN